MDIKKIWATEASEYTTDTASEPHLKLERLNILIGPNNSGKSRLLRKLFSSPLGKLHIGLGQEFQQAAESLGSAFELIKEQPKIGEIKLNQFLEIHSGKCTPLEQLHEKISEFITAINNAANPNMRISGGDIGCFHGIRKIFQNNSPREKLTALANTTDKLKNLKRHYIPILRGMRPLEGNADLFLQRTHKDYFTDTQTDNLSIITGFNLYNLLVSNLLGQPSDRARIRAYEKILGNEFFGGAEVTLIPEFGKDTVAVKIGEDDQFPIYNLGDGLQQVIIITSSVFLEHHQSLFFIEEPEICLHPGLLRKLALFLLEHTSHQYLITTHSNHLLDLAETNSDVLIHRISKTPRNSGPFKIHECTRDRELLNDLGVLASSIYLANSTIWVEGITDRLYLQAFMKKYLSILEDDQLKEKYEGFLENFHYSFVEYQGGTLGHWGFDDTDTTDRLSASRTCSTAFLIADGDITNKGERVTTLKSELGDRLYILNCKEIENILPTQIIEATSIRIFERKKSKTTEGLDRNNLRKILNTNTEESNIGIGYHLDKCLGLKGKGKDTRRVFADESGTISDKVKFCREALEVMNDTNWELSTPIKSICSAIYTHISMCN